MKHYSYQRLKKICLDNTADVETIKAAATDNTFVVKCNGPLSSSAEFCIFGALASVADVPTSRAQASSSDSIIKSISAVRTQNHDDQYSHLVEETSAISVKFWMAANRTENFKSRKSKIRSRGPLFNLAVPNF